MSFIIALSSYDLLFYVFRFVIDPDSGDITVHLTEDNKLDREQVSRYFLTVIATDGEGSSSSANLEITVSDENDQTPT